MIVDFTKSIVYSLFHICKNIYPYYPEDEVDVLHFY